MAAKKPEIEEGYLGPQANFKELGLVPLSHPDPEVTVRDNHLEIKIQAKNHIKFTHQLINCRSGLDLSKYVFSQVKEGVAHFLVHMPTADYYKLQIYALPAADPSKSLPNIFNYLINCTTAVQSVYPFPKQFAQWKDGCYLHEPLVLHLNSKLTNINWYVNVPHANAVAVVVDDEWHHFENKGGPVWKAVFSLDKHRKKGTKITMSANFQGAEENKFSTLLEYILE